VFEVNSLAFGFPLLYPTWTAMADLSHLSVRQPIDVEELRQRLAKMSDAALQGFGAASKFMCSPQANLGKPPRDVFAIQLKEARKEWRRRHPG
jgi:hypothetical protein